MNATTELKVDETVSEALSKIDERSESVTPLIEASEVYPLLEERISLAKREVLLAFRILDPDTKLRSERLTGRGLRTWGDLIADVSARGVEVRILLTDFEPTVATDLHKLTWASVRGFHAARTAMPSADNSTAGGLQIIAALHEAKVGKLLRWVFWPIVWLRVRSMAREVGVAPSELLADAPGLAPLLGTRDGRTMLPRFGPPPRLRPATYHQKLALIDGSFLVIGGLDINERRYDTPTHDQPPEETWHDVSLAVTGPACDDARAHFQECWNREVKPYNQRIKRLRRFVRNLPGQVKRMEPVPIEPQHIRDDESKLTFIRTISRQRRTLIDFGPKPAIMEIEKAHIDAIRQAERMIYIETQFLRSREIVQALVEAGTQKPALRLIVLLPSAPQEVLFEGATGSPHRHGEWLQLECVDAVLRAFGDRVAFYSLVNRSHSHETEDRGSIDGHPVIYIHSKVFIVDHRLAIISSANLNGRSLRWDTEAGMLWKDEEQVRAFEQRLWENHLGSSFDAQKIQAKTTEARNAELFGLWKLAGQGGPEGGVKPSYIAPFPYQEGKDFARKSWFVPDDLV